MSDAASNPSRRINPLTLWLPVIFVVGGLVIFWNYLVKLQAEKAQPRLPILTRLEKNITFTERSGRQVELKDLKGKVIVACWVYTRCPRGCTGVAGEMRKLFRELDGNPNVHFLSVSVDPDDKPEDLKRFADGLGLKEGDNWWFVNGPKDEVRTAMVRYFGFNEVRELSEKERMAPDDKFEHDMRVALVDMGGHVRGLYGIANTDREVADFFQQKLRDDIKTLLAGEGSSK